ncbi:MAG: hypothetical protein M0R17_02680 [Candidatus Omnitrophica bacterium]|nr:hypothetical protein [Candidatus Omnitrophota bacterium]
MNKVNIKQTQKEINKKLKFIELTKQYIKDLKKFKYGIYEELNDNIKDEQDNIKRLIKQLTCEHKNTEKLEDYDYHNDVYKPSSIICMDCGFILED